MPAAAPPPPVVADVALATVVVYKAAPDFRPGGGATGGVARDALHNFLQAAARAHCQVAVARNPARALRDGVPTVFRFARDVPQAATGDVPASVTVAETVTVVVTRGAGGALTARVTRRDTPVFSAHWVGPQPPTATDVVSEKVRTIRPGDSVLLDTFGWPGGVASYVFAVVSAPGVR